jgi:replicative DNA helicase
MPVTLSGTALLSCLRRLGSSTALREVPEAFFTEPEERAAFQWLQNYVRQHHAFPGVIPFRLGTRIQPVVTNEPLSYYMDRARQRALYKEIFIRSGNLRDAMVSKQPDRFIEIAEQIVALKQRFAAQRREQTFAEALDQVMGEFQDTKWSGGLRGIDTGYPFLNDATGGWQSGDNIALVGRIGREKLTWR